MKKLIPIVILMTIVIIAQAQSPVAQNPFPKTITVAGSAEMEIIPDEIYVNIQLTEYQKKGNPKKDIEAIKSQFLESCKTTGIADSLSSIASYSGYNNYYGWKKNRKKDPNLFATVTYQVKFKSSKVMDDLVEKLDDEATSNFQIVSTSHSKMTEFRKQLKIEAIKAAKDKGIYLTEAINEKLGEAITINEPDAASFGNFYMGNALVSNNAYSQSNVNYRDDDRNDGSDTPEPDFKKIKLRYEVTVIFAIR
jgi:uncharacterized protein